MWRRWYPWAMNKTKPEPPRVRRIVTGHDQTGKAVVWIDGPAERQNFPDSYICATHLWVTDETPADFTASEDAGLRVRGTAPPPGGTAFAVVDIQPGNALPPLHRTDSLDYVVCVSGEVDMQLDGETVRMKAGDVMIQRGTNHAWVNGGSVPVRLAFVMVDGKPKRAGSLGGLQNAR
jgi:quercetin dioxygenase-like cupin family protein